MKAYNIHCLIYLLLLIIGTFDILVTKIIPAEIHLLITVILYLSHLVSLVLCPYFIYLIIKKKKLLYVYVGLLNIIHLACIYLTTIYAGLMLHEFYVHI